MDTTGSKVAGKPAGITLTEQAESVIDALRSSPCNSVLAQARTLLPKLRGERAYDQMQRLSEIACRIDPGEPGTRLLYAQALIETGAVIAAIDMLRQMQASLPTDSSEHAEASGLLGRCFKQVFLESAQPLRWALDAAIQAYAEPWRAAPRKNSWHGVNVLALVSRARMEGWLDLAPDINPVTLSVQLVAMLRAIPDQHRDEWYLPTLAEATLGLGLATGDLQPVEDLLAAYIGSPEVQAFQVASTLRQFTEVWSLEALNSQTRGIGLQGEAAIQRARRLTDVLRARLLELPGGELTIPAALVAGVTKPRAQAIGKHQHSDESQAATAQLETILGTEGPQTFAWWRAGIEAARSVAVVRQRLGKRLGTGFLVSAGDFGLAPADEPLLLTNFHVINTHGTPRGIKPADAEVLFEAADANLPCAVAEVVWSSPIEQHDACLLRLQRLPPAIAPLSISTDLPQLPEHGAKKRPRVYIIGYPGGRELSFSFQDNELIDHEGPPGGQPQIANVCRVHYFAPTEGGNSGSPVFEDSGWRVIALHHSGGKYGMPRLNGQTGTYAANEGLALAQIVAAVRDSLA